MVRSVPAVVALSLVMVFSMVMQGFAEDGASPRRVYTHVPGVAWARSGMITFDLLLEKLSEADVVFLGEYHDDAASHALQLELLRALDKAHNGTVVLTMEQFERDVQSQVDAYMSAKISEEEFLANSRPWPNYPTDYRPMVEYCKGNGNFLVAANIPRPLASRIAKEGFDAAWAAYTDEERQWIAEETTHGKDQYWDNFSMLMGGSGHGMQMEEDMILKFFAAQCIKDDTMAESIARVREGEGSPVVHINGSFHSDYGLGTVSRLASRRPGDNIVTVALRPVDGWSNATKGAEDLENGMHVADYIVYVPSPNLGQPAVKPEGPAEDSTAAE